MYPKENNSPIQMVSPFQGLGPKNLVFFPKAFFWGFRVIRWLFWLAWLGNDGKFQKLFL